MRKKIRKNNLFDNRNSTHQEKKDSAFDTFESRYNELNDIEILDLLLTKTSIGVVGSSQNQSRRKINFELERQKQLARQSLPVYYDDDDDAKHDESSSPQKDKGKNDDNNCVDEIEIASHQVAFKNDVLADYDFDLMLDVLFE